MKAIFAVLFLSVVVFAQPAPSMNFSKPDSTYSGAGNLKLLPISFLSLLLSLDAVGDANDLTNQINDIRRIDKDADVSRLTSIRKRKRIYAAGFAILAVVNGIIAISPTKNIQITPRAVQVSIRF